MLDYHVLADIVNLTGRPIFIDLDPISDSVSLAGFDNIMRSD